MKAAKDKCEHGVPYEHPIAYCAICLRAAMRCEGPEDKPQSYSDWSATTIDASCEPMTLEKFEKAAQKMMDDMKKPREPPYRIVNPRHYAEAKRGLADGATAYEAELLLIGYKWEDVKAARGTNGFGP